ncbi:MAG: hypothetical protein K0R67_2612, partial [Paenibacillus sp.]|nr:hypothetical protein [Paenibacillus sp.]
VGKKVDPALIRQSSGNVFEFIQNGPDGKKLIVQQRSDYTGWTLVYEIPLTVLSEELLSLQRITTVVIVCLIGFALIVLGGFAYRMTRRIMFLQKLMYQAEWGGLDVKIPIDGRGRDEIGKLYRGLNNLLAEIRRLIGELQASRDKEKELRMREKESMIQIMQSQINPHFLYNTLEVINSHAILQGYKPISSMALSLSRMLRYSVSNHEHIVSLAEEAKHIRWYCNILQQRCETLRTVILMDEDAARSVACVRLTLQPLVENAFLHGYEKLGRDPEWIEVTGERNGEDYIVRIADGGQGMSMEQIKHYNEAFAISSPLSGELPSSIQGVGLWNVHRRIRLTFGETYGLHIEESTNVGTAILIRLPAGAFQTNS